MTNEPSADLAKLSELSPEERGRLFDRIKSRRPRGSNVSLVDRNQTYFDTSFAQRQMWYLHNKEQGNAYYNAPIVLRISGKFSYQLLEITFSKILQRHEILRTTYTTVDGNIVQVIHDLLPPHFTYDDLSSAPSSDQTRRVDEITEEEGRRLFDLVNGPMLCVRSVQLSEAECMVFITFHHIVADGWSSGVLLREFCEIFNALSSDSSPNLPDLKIQYVDYAIWQRSFVNSEAGEKSKRFWLDKLNNVEKTELLTDKSRHQKRSYCGDRYFFEISDDVALKIASAARRLRVTPMVCYLGAYLILLNRLTRQRDLCIGSPIANRKNLLLEPLLGCFVNTLPLRVEIDPSLSIDTFINVVSDQVQQVLDHQDYPFEKIVEHLGGNRESDRNPLFDILFVFQNAPMGDFFLRDLNVDVLPVSNKTTKFDLNLVIETFGNQYQGYVEYDTDLFHQKTINALAEAYKYVLTYISNEIDVNICDLQLQPQEHAIELLGEFKPHHQRSSKVHNLVERFTHAVQNYPDNIAVIDNNRILTYRELDGKSNALAIKLKKSGVKAGEFVGIITPKSLETIIAILATLKLGAVYLPIDPIYPYARQKHIIEDAGVRCLLTNMKFSDLQEESYSGAKIIEFSSEALDEIAFDHVLCGPDHLAYVIYTSGSTGLPKGVQVSHKNVLRLFDATEHWFEFSSSETWLLFHSYAFDFSVWEIFGALLHGGKLIIASYETAQSSQATLKLILDHNVTFLNQTPSAFYAIQEQLRELNVTEWPVKTIVFGGEELSADRLSWWFSNSPLHEMTRLVNMYGITETTVHVSYKLLGPDAAKLNNRSVGQAIPDLGILLLDEFGHIVPRHFPGEISVYGAGVSHGYLNRDDLNAEKFPRSKLIGGKSLYRSGDLGKVNLAGEIDYLGRIDTQVKCRGYRIELGEIESVLREIKGIDDAAVVMKSSSSGDQLIAFVRKAQDLANDDTANEWQEVFDSTYEQLKQIGDPRFAFTGWLDTYSNTQIPDLQMVQWADATAERILTTKPKHILEIGTGSGLLLCRLLPNIASYRGTDFSSKALSYVSHGLKSLGFSTDRVELDVNEALSVDYANVLQSIDTVVINSVIQYFPSRDYFLRVLDKILRNITKPTTLFIGDVRNRALQTTFYSSIELLKADENNLVREILQRATRRALSEKEIIVDPDFFFGLQRKYPGITAVKIQTKEADYENELSKYRYDVSITVNGKEAHRPVNWLESPTYEQLIEDLDASLNNGDVNSVVGLLSVQNPLLSRDSSAKKIIDSSEKNATVADLRSQISQHPYSDNTLARLSLWASENGFQLETRLFSATQKDCFSVLIGRDLDCLSVENPYAQSVSDEIHKYVNDPSLSFIDQAQAKRLSEQLERKLPKYMLPNNYISVESIPLTEHGKVNRAYLQNVAESYSLFSSHDFIAPRSETEKRLVEIWQDLLDVENIGVTDDFFLLGGHSLLATRIVARVKKQFDKDIAIKDVFDCLTIDRMAEKLDGMSCGNIKSIPHIDVKPDRLPLSSAQERLWIIQTQEPQSAAYSICGALEICGALSILKLQHALNTILERHSILRAKFFADEQGTFQRIRPLDDFALNQLDCIGWAQSDLDDYFALQASRPFDLHHDPLLRIVVCKMTEDLWYLFINMHHIVADGWSIGLFKKELSALYDDSADLPVLAIDYADYALWLQQQDIRNSAQEKGEYWRVQLMDISSNPLVGSEVEDPQKNDPQGLSVYFDLDADFSRKVFEYARAKGVTLYVVLLTAYKFLLSKYAYTNDVVVGSPIANRQNHEIENLIGFFVNTLPFRTHLSNTLSLEENLRRVQVTVNDGLSFQDFPFDDMVRTLGISGAIDTNPLFQTMLILQNAPIEVLRMSDLRVRDYDIRNTSAKFDLTYEFMNQGDKLRCRIEFRNDRFSRSSMEDMFETFTFILNELINNDQKILGNLEIDRGLHQSLVCSQPATPNYSSLCEMVQNACSKWSASIALEDENLALSYSEIDQLSAQFAAYLSSKGIRSGDVVGLAVSKSVFSCLAQLSVIKAGAAFLCIDPDMPIVRIHSMLKAADVKLLLVDERLGQHALDVEIEFLQKAFDLAAKMAPINVTCSQCPSLPAYIVFTSGSTGEPKGVIVPQNVVMNLVEWQLVAMPSRPGAVTLQFAPSIFDVSVQEFFHTLISGGQYKIMPDALRTDLDYTLKVISDKQVDRIYMPFVALQEIAVLNSRKRFDYFPREIITAGERLQTTKQIRQLVQDHRATLYNQYGPSESHVVTHYRLGENVDTWESLPSIGTPIRGTQLYVLDQGLNRLPPNAVGELYIGQTLANAYARNSAQTAEKFLPNPFYPLGHRMYKTGDLVVYRNNGEIDYLGRTDNQVKLNGYRVELSEIEQVASAHDCVTTCVADLISVGKRQRIVLCVKGGEAIDTHLLMQHMHRYLPRYMLPQEIVFLADLPKTVTGKIDRLAVRAALSNELVHSRRTRTAVSPLEKQIATIWSQLLEIDNVYLDDGFFELGGNSLMGTRAVTLINDQLGISLSVQDFFSASNLADLVCTVENILWVSDPLTNPKEDKENEFDEGEI